VFTPKILTDYHQVFGTPAGRRVLADIAKSAHIYGQIFDSNPYKMALKEGERAMVLRLFRVLKMKPSEIEKLIEEESDELA
jgi:hypothetical protein